MHVLVASSLSRDVNELAGCRIDRLGGAVIHSGLVYSGLGADTTVTFRSTLDDLNLARELLGARVRIQHQLSDVTTAFANCYAPDARRTQRILALAPTIDVCSAVGPVDLVHLSPLHQADLAPAWFDVTTTIAIDLQGLLRPAQPGIVRHRCSPGIHGCLARARYVKASAAEMTVLLAHLGTGERELTQHYPETEFLISEGHRGGRILPAEGIEARWHAQPLDAAVDTTGAGDMFFAAFLTYRQRLPAAPAAAHAATLTHRLLRDGPAHP
jgi:hypothetical protein